VEFSLRARLAIATGLLCAPHAVGAPSAPSSASASTSGPASAASASVQPAGRGSAPNEAEAERRLLMLLAPKLSDAPFDVEAFAQRILDLGPHAVAPCLAMLIGDLQLPAVADGTSDEAIDPRVQDAHHRILQRAFAQFAPSVRLAALVRRAQGAELHVRRLLIALLGETAHPRALPEILATVEPIEEIHLMRDYIAGAIRTALAARLADHPRGAELLEQAAREGSGPVRDLVVKTLGGARSFPAFEALERLLALDSQLDVFVLRALAEGAPTGLVAPRSSTLDFARSQLQAPSDIELQLAALTLLATCGSLEDFADLVDQLESDDPRVSNLARRSLQSVLDVDLGPAREPWLDWLALEATWTETELEACLERIESSDDAQSIDALRQLSRHPFAVRIAGRQLAETLLVERSPTVFAAQIEALSSSPPEGFVLALLRQLEGEDTQRREQAAQTLRALTKLSLGPDVGAWEAALIGRGADVPGVTRR
jgi:hypothetical protein